MARSSPTGKLRVELVGLFAAIGTDIEEALAGLLGHGQVARDRGGTGGYAAAPGHLEGPGRRAS